MNFKLQREKQLKNDIYHAGFGVISIFVLYMKATFSSNERLKSKIQIDKLFEEGNTLSVFPLRLVYKSFIFNDTVAVKAGVSVSKRNFKMAVDRNRIKRLMREAYRLNKNMCFNNITTQYALMILYLGKDMPDFDQVDNTMKKLLKQFVNDVSE